MSTPANKIERRYAISKLPQADYLTPTDTTDPSGFKEFLRTDENLALHEVKTEDNKDESTGHMHPTNEYKTVHDTSVSTERRVYSEEVGSDLYHTLGSVTTTQPDATNVPAVKQHVFKMQDLAVSKQSLARTYIEIVAGVINKKFPSMVVEEFGLKSSGVGRLSQTMNMRGSGKETRPSGLVVADIDTIRLTGLHPFMHTMLKLIVADAGTIANPVDYSQSGNYVDSWDVSIKKNHLLDEGYVPGAGLYDVANDPTSGALRSECLIDTYELALNAVVRLLNDSDQLAAMRAKKQLDFAASWIGAKIGTTAFNHKLTTHAPRLSYDMVELGSSKGLVTAQIKAKIFFDATTNREMDFTLINDVASYTS